MGRTVTPYALIVPYAVRVHVELVSRYKDTEFGIEIMPDRPERNKQQIRDFP